MRVDDLEYLNNFLRIKQGLSTSEDDTDILGAQKKITNIVEKFLTTPFSREKDIHFYKIAHFLSLWGGKITPKEKTALFCWKGLEAMEKNDGFTPMAAFFFPFALRYKETRETCLHHPKWRDFIRTNQNIEMIEHALCSMVDSDMGMHEKRDVFRNIKEMFDENKLQYVLNDNAFFSYAAKRGSIKSWMLLIRESGLDSHAIFQKKATLLTPMMVNQTPVTLHGFIVKATQACELLPYMEPNHPLRPRILYDLLHEACEFSARMSNLHPFPFSKKTHTALYNGREAWNTLQTHGLAPKELSWDSVNIIMADSQASSKHYYHDVTINQVMQAIDVIENKRALETAVAPILEQKKKTTRTLKI